jgi:putative ABC transport system permease protein
MSSFTRELRQAWRSLWHRKAYFLTCAATLTLVLGANAALFAVANSTMLRPMPFATRGPIVHLYVQPPGTTAVLQRNPLQQMEVPRLRERARTLARVEGFLLSERVITLDGEPGTAQTAAVTPGLLAMMAAPVAQGRSFAAVEGAPGHFVAVVSDRYWHDALGSAKVIGTTLVIDNQPHTIVGILSPAFGVPFIDAQVFTPLVTNAEPQPRAPPRSVVGLAELAPGVSIEQARAELTTVYGQLAKEFPRTHNGWTIGAEDAREWQYGPMQAPLLMLLAAGLLVLLIACVNVANLTSAQAVARAGELSLRLALGASTTDVVRVRLAELLIICASGLVPGLILAWAAVPALLASNPTVAKALGDVTIDWRVQGLTALAALLTAASTSAVLTWRGLRGPTSAMLSLTGTRTAGSARAIRTQRLLVSVEVALCLTLLMAGAVLMQGLRDLSRRGPGYESNGILTAQIRMPEASYKTPDVRAIAVTRMLEGIRAVPGVVSVGMTQNAFLPGFSYQTLITVKERPSPDGQPQTVQFRRVSPDYFRTMGIRTLDGRVFTDNDTADAAPVAVVSKRFADTMLTGLEPLGRLLARNNPPDLTIVGVVNDVADVSVPEKPEPTMYLPWGQNNNFGVPVALVIRSKVVPESLTSAVRDVVRGVDPALPLRRVQTLDTFVNESTAPERFRTTVLGLMAALGLVLAALGIAGVTYRSVTDRTREFAVRLALGSDGRAVVGLVLTESMRNLAVGILAGFLGGTALCAVLARSLTNIGSVSAATTGPSVAILVVVAMVAALIPALRVTRVQPAAVLRS